MNSLVAGSRLELECFGLCLDCLNVEFVDILDQLGGENIFVTKIDAITSIFGRLDRSICERCDKRIFLECQKVEYKGEKLLGLGAFPLDKAFDQH